jgi:hypothetical protein
LAGVKEPALLRNTLQQFVESGGIPVIVRVLANCLAAPCQLQWAADESFGQQGCMRTMYILEVLGRESHRPVWLQASPEDQQSVIAVVIHTLEAAMQVSSSHHGRHGSMQGWG